MQPSKPFARDPNTKANRHGHKAELYMDLYKVSRPSQGFVGITVPLHQFQCCCFELRVHIFNTPEFVWPTIGRDGVLVAFGEEYTDFSLDAIIGFKLLQPQQCMDLYHQWLTEVSQSSFRIPPYPDVP